MSSRLLPRCLCALGAFAILAGPSARPAGAQRAAHPPLTSTDIDDIARLELLEDHRQFDSTEFARLLAAPHPELRRRAALAVGRIVDKRGLALLRAHPLDADTAVAATVVFAVGQLRDTSSIAWLDSLLSGARTPPTVATEAAIALGKIPVAASREALARFLATATAGPRTSDAIGEALLSIGRSAGRGDITPIARWTRSPSEELRWRATWALFRPRDPAAVATLLAMSKDPSPLVRSWAVRGLGKPQADSADAGAASEALLIAATRDADRRVRTEAVRALGTYSDSAAIATLVVALQSPDSWISVSAAEGLGRIRAASTIPSLTAATAASRSCAVRITAMQALQAFARSEALAASLDVASDTVPYCRTTALQAHTTLLDTTPRVAGRGGGRQARPPAPAVTRTLDEYRRIVEQWVVPDYNGAPRPTARWDTPRGSIDIELYPGDAPLAVDDFVRRMESGAIVGTEFSRVVPDFVNQQRTIRDATLLRDEVNRHGLTRANLSWATGGLDTGRPGYTLGHTAQPHNEGNFTALGRVIRGMDVVDRIELGDRVVGARMLTGNRP